MSITWWRHQMETFSALLALCAGNSSVPGEFPAQRPVTRSFDVFFGLHPIKRLSKQWWGCWFETPPCSLDVTVMRKEKTSEIYKKNTSQQTNVMTKWIGQKRIPKSNNKVKNHILEDQTRWKFVTKQLDGYTNIKDMEQMLSGTYYKKRCKQNYETVHWSKWSQPAEYV